LNQYILQDLSKIGKLRLLADLLGHPGHLHEAENMMKAMPCKPNVAVWMALLSACRIHGNVQMGEHIAKQVLEL
jgi:hypothetical protein